MRTSAHPIEALLPHGRAIILIDRLIEWEEGYVKTSTTIETATPFFNEGSVAAHVGLEFMAQTCGVYAGLKALEAGDRVKLGFLLGTRNFRATVAAFKHGDRLEMTAREVMFEDQVAAFDCRIFIGGEECASALLNLYRPENIDAILGGGERL